MIKLDRQTLLVVQEWIQSAPGPEHESYYYVSDKVEEALKTLKATPSKNDGLKLELVSDVMNAVIHSVLVCNGVKRGSEETADKRELRAVKNLLTVLLGREPTETEMSEVIV